METMPSGTRSLGAKASSNQRTGRIVAALLIAATVMMWWSGKDADDTSCTTYGARPQDASLTTLGEVPIGCTG